MADAPDVLEVRNFAQIRKARIEFGDLTVLVGPQATGKSLLLQLLKLSLDYDPTVGRMSDAGLRWQGPGGFFELYLGEGMGRAWRATSRVHWNGRSRLAPYLFEPDSPPRVLYVPAQRALILSEGWPSRFERLNERTPVVARLFSDELFRLLSRQEGGGLFPDRWRLSPTLARLIDGAILHGGRIGLRTRAQANKVELLFGRSGDGIQFPAWSTGQRELMPLVLGLYQVPFSKYKWLIVEEPEMGLHPRGIEVVMLLVLELARRGLRVVLSTHSPNVVEVIWAIQRLAEHRATPRHVLEVFGVQGKKDLLPLARRALAANYRVHSLNYEGAHVVARDISRLDPSSVSHAEAFWGGLTEFSSRVSDLVTRLSR